MSTEAVKQNEDGTVSVTFKPPSPDWRNELDKAWQRMERWCSGPGQAGYRWHFVSMSVPSYSFGYIVVLEKKGVTHSMSGSASLEMAVAGFGFGPEAALDSAVELAKVYEASDAKKEYDAEQTRIAAEPY